jgi:hypothetical protein
MYLMILFYSFLLMDGMEVQSWVLRFRWRIYKIVMYIVSPKYNLFDVLSHDNVSWHEFFLICSFGLEIENTQLFYAYLLISHQYSSRLFRKIR